MPLRPRYSLLTLLVLTALVAGGVKLWRGPHRVVMSTPPTAEETTLLHGLAHSELLQKTFAPVTFEYEYVNDWNNRRLLLVKGVSTAAQPIPLYRSMNYPERGYLFTHGPLPPPLLLLAEIQTIRDEHVVCWIYPVTKDGKSMTQVFDPPVLLPGGAKTVIARQATIGYFLSNHKKLYRCQGSRDADVPLYNVELSDIADPEFRECVARELALIPDPN